VRPISSKRLLMSTGAIWPLGFCLNRSFSLSKTPICRRQVETVPHSMFAKIDDAGNFCTQVLAGHDAIDEAMFEKKLAGLEALGQFETDGVPDGSLAGKADQ